MNIKQTTQLANVLTWDLVYNAQRSETLHVRMIILFQRIESLWNIIPLDWIMYMLYSLPGI